MQEEIFIPPPPPVDWPLRLELAGISYCDGSYRISRRNTPTCVLEYVVSGRGVVEIDGEITRPETGDLYLIPSYTENHYHSDATNPWIKYWFNVSGPMADALFDLYRLRRRTLVHHFRRPELFREGLRELYRHPNEAHLRIMPRLLMEITATAAGQLAEQTPSGHTPAGLIMRKLLEKHLHSPAPSAAELGRAIRRSPTQAIRIFRKEFGSTPRQYLLNRKMEVAMQLLRHSSHGLKEIADILGFAGEYHFAALFKRKKGIPPGRFRTGSPSIPLADQASCDGTALGKNT